jgi:hypothetical protein
MVQRIANKLLICVIVSFRLGKVVMNTSIEEKILTGFFFVQMKSNEIT